MASKKTAVAVAAGVLALGAGVGIAGVAAADPTPTPSPTATASGTPTPGSDRPDGGPHGGGFRGGGDLSELAGKLGVTESKLQDALKAIRDENRSATKPDNQTPEQRDGALAKALAAKLNIDEAKVASALAEIRTARQADEAAALKAKLDAAVKAGTLTQAEADAVTKAVQQGVINVGGRGPR